MRILALDLENIKSYGHAHLDFTGGLNAICGRNGSGKTTILEAIGFALFDYLPYSQEQFVREGEKAGTIRVRLAAADGREYEVVRRAGKSASAFYVVDLETGGRLAERKEGVLDWIRSKALNLEPDTDLEALFKNAVGVPQGAMTADFLVNTGARKNIFDPLLRVEEYRAAFEQLRDTNSYLRDRRALMTEEIARLESQTERIPEVKREVGSLQDQLNEIEEKLSRMTAELATAEAARQVLDGVEQRLRALDDAVRGADYDVRRSQDHLAVAEEGLRRAREANEVVAEAEPGYRLVQGADEELYRLDKLRSRRDGLRAAIANVKGEMEGTTRQIGQLEAEIRTAHEQAQGAERLRPDVERQDRLELELAGAAAAAKQAERLDRDLKTCRTEIETVERELNNLRARLAEAEKAQAEAGSLLDLESEADRLQQELIQLDAVERESRQVRDRGEHIRREHDDLEAEYLQWQRDRDELATLETAAAALAEVRARRDALREARAAVMAGLEYQSVTRGELERGQCPLLDLACPVVGADPESLARLDHTARELAERRGQLERDLEALSPELAAAEQRAERAAHLMVEVARRGSIAARKAEVEAELEACRARYRELQSALSRRSLVEAERQQMKARLEAARRAEKAASLRAELQQQEERDHQRLQQAQARRQALEQEWSTVATAVEEVQRLQRELEALVDPRRRQQELLAGAARAANLEARLQDEQRRREEQRVEWEKLRDQLRPFEPLDDQREAQQLIRQTNIEAYERYLQFWQEAQQVASREEGVRIAADQLEQAQAALATAEKEREMVRARYDAAEHERLRKSCEELYTDIASVLTSKEHLEGTLERATGDLGSLLRQQEKLDRCRDERDELERTAVALGFIRDTIRAAGPAVTETLLSQISLIANDIYAEIVDDHASELRWNPEYDVVVQRGAEERRFAQLSGGEQMSAALAVRLALLKEMSEVNFAFFDEPTQNMDAERRVNLAGQVSQIKGFDQLMVISHDDTFEHHTDNLIRLRKVHEQTQVDG